MPTRARVLSDPRTRLAIIRPVLIDSRIVDLAQRRHEGHLPEDRLRPRPRGFDLDAAIVALWSTWHKGHPDLGRLEAIR